MSTNPSNYVHTVRNCLERLAVKDNNHYKTNKERKNKMAVKYKIYQSQRKGAYNGKWYARVAHDGTVTTDDLANTIQNNCSMKRSDVLAVISELVEVMKTQLQNSMRVKLDGFGTFKIGINTTAANSAKDFTQSSNIKGVHVIFQPEVKIDAQGVRNKMFVNGTKLQEASVYDIDKSDSSDSSTTGE